MYLQVLKFVTPKRLLIVAVVVSVFAAGWLTNGWRYKAKIASSEAAMLESYAKQRELLLQEHRAQQEIDSQAAETLTADLEKLRQQRRVLQEKLLTAAVVKTHDEICGNGGTGNPFGADFAGLWNGTAPD